MVSTVKNESQFAVLLGGPYNQAAFTEMSGGEVTRDAEEYPNGLTDDMNATIGLSKYSEITLKAPYNPDEHDPMIVLYQNYCGEPIDIVVTPIRVCPERAPDGRSRIYSRCIPTAVTPPDVNRGGSKTAMFVLKFKPQGLKLS